VSIEQMVDILDKLVVTPSLAGAPRFEVTVKKMHALRKG
jgi:hypothetical protein